MFKKASEIRDTRKIKLGITGPAGSGKTFTSLLISKGMGLSKVAVLDTENASSALYSELRDFDVVNITAPYTPEKYMDVIDKAIEAGYEMLIIDSMSHEWEGEGGCLDIQSALANGAKYNSYTAWSKVTPRHNAFIQKILQADIHLICCFRVKTEYAMNTDDNGKIKGITKVGLAPKQREGLDYELTCVLDIDRNHNFTCSKDRTGLFPNVDVPEKAGEEIGVRLKGWLGSGATVKQAAIDPAIKEKVTALIGEWGSSSSEEKFALAKIYLDTLEPFVPDVTKEHMKKIMGDYLGRVKDAA